MIERRMTKGSFDFIKKLVSIKGARVAPSGTKGDLVTLGGKAKEATEKGMATKLANDVNGVKSVKKTDDHRGVQIISGSLPRHSETVNLKRIERRIICCGRSL